MAVKEEGLTDEQRAKIKDLTKHQNWLMENADIQYMCYFQGIDLPTFFDVYLWHRYGIDSILKNTSISQNKAHTGEKNGES